MPPSCDRALPTPPREPLREKGSGGHCDDRYAVKAPLIAPQFLEQFPDADLFSIRGAAVDRIHR
jgi:hypothetical protein